MPKKVGRKAALRHWKTAVKTGLDQRAMIAAAEFYARHVEQARDPYVLNGSTFFNNIEDWMRGTCPKCGDVCRPRSTTKPGRVDGAMLRAGAAEDRRREAAGEDVAPATDGSVLSRLMLGKGRKG
jgi:hypothetical protein